MLITITIQSGKAFLKDTIVFINLHVAAELCVTAVFSLCTVAILFTHCYCLKALPNFRYPIV